MTPRDRVLALLERYGRDTTSFQALERGLSYWFDGDDAACVAYADTGGAWIAVGSPIAAPERVREVAARFAAAARQRGRRVRFFGLEEPIAGQLDASLLHIGEQPSWDPAAWPEVVRGKRSLREQLRRARAKGVTVRRVPAAELGDPASPARRGIDALVARWKDSRAMAPMGFVVEIDLYSHAAERRFHVAERAGQVVGFLAAVPIYARGGWFFEDVLRHPAAPNGTVELLFDHAMRDAAAAGSSHVSFGLAPLAGSPSRVLRFIRDRTRWLYHFDGLRAFKSKLQPTRWEPVYLGYPRGERGVRAVLDALVAFAHGSLWRFGLATLRHRAATVTRVLALLLVPWTAAMAWTDTARWFPSSGVKMGWIGLDVFLFVALMVLASRWRRSLAVTLSAAALGDFALGCVQAALYNGARAGGVLEWIVIGLALGAPFSAAVFLWSCRNRNRLYRSKPVKTVSHGSFYS